MGYKDPEKAAEYARGWRARHAEQVKEEDRQRRARQRVEDPSAATQKMREWRAANPEKAKAQADIGNKKYKERLATDPEFKEKERLRKAVYLAVPEVKERRKKQFRDWRREERAKDPTLDRKRALKFNYGLTSEQYDAMALAQDGKCAVCRTDKLGGKGKRLHVDHCHDCDTVRELLCHACNTGLGAFKDDPARLRAAAAYLERHQCP